MFELFDNHSRENSVRSIYQNSGKHGNEAFSSNFHGWLYFFWIKSLVGINKEKNTRKFEFFSRKPRSHVRILIYRSWAIDHNLSYLLTSQYLRQTTSPSYSMCFTVENMEL